jgi:hypothetical protein
MLQHDRGARVRLVLEGLPLSPPWLQCSTVARSASYCPTRVRRYVSVPLLSLARVPHIPKLLRFTDRVHVDAAGTSLPSGASQRRSTATPTWGRQTLWKPSVVTLGSSTTTTGEEGVLLAGHNAPAGSLDERVFTELPSSPGPYLVSCGPECGGIFGTRSQGTHRR